MPEKRKRTPPILTERRRHQQAALSLGVPQQDYDKAEVLGQLAVLLSQHPKLGTAIAFKGGAILRMAHEVPRFSKDLDASAVARQRPIRAAWVREVLEAHDRTRRGFVQAGYQLIEQGKRLHTEGLVCTAPSGQSVGIGLEFNWHEKLLIPEIEMLPIRAAGLGQVTIPVMHRVERAAEKLRAFLDRARGADAADLHFFRKLVLLPGQLEAVRRLLEPKFKANPYLHDVKDFPALFDERLAASEADYRAGAAIISGSPPKWTEIAESLAEWRALL